MKNISPKKKKIAAVKRDNRENEKRASESKPNFFIDEDWSTRVKALTNRRQETRILYLLSY